MGEAIVSLSAFRPGKLGATCQAQTAMTAYFISAGSSHYKATGVPVNSRVSRIECKPVNRKVILRMACVGVKKAGSGSCN
jgi:hypothetical protein